MAFNQFMRTPSSMRKKRSSVTFRQLRLGEKFIFASESNSLFLGLAKGPWTKTGSRTYQSVSEPVLVHRVGSISVKVERK